MRDFCLPVCCACRGFAFSWSLADHAFIVCSLKRNGQLDFSDPKAVMQLTKSSLKLHFGLEMELPDDRLCPPVSWQLDLEFVKWTRYTMLSTCHICTVPSLGNN